MYIYKGKTKPFGKVVRLEKYNGVQPERTADADGNFLMPIIKNPTIIEIQNKITTNQMDAIIPIVATAICQAFLNFLIKKI